jgi:hypothetical protein
MKLDCEYIDASEAAERDAKAGINIYGYVGHREMAEGEDFGDFLKSQDTAYQERVIKTVGTWEDNARELHYQREGEERYTYVLSFHPDVDVWSQSVYIFSQSVPDSQLADIIEMIRSQEKDLDQFVYEHRKQIDKAYPPYWRLINYNWEMSTIAYHLVRQGWTPQAERILSQWGAYNSQEGVGLENLLVKSLLTYGQLIMQQNDPNGYVLNLIENAGKAGRLYRKLV